MTELPLIYAVYIHPPDDPDKIVVRGWRGLRAERISHGFDTIEDAREWLQGRGLTRLERQAGDDPCIAETWL